MDKYSKLTNEEFDRILIKQIKEMSAEQLIQIPGIYEILSEDLNNAILNEWEKDQEGS